MSICVGILSIKDKRSTKASVQFHGIELTNWNLRLLFQIQSLLQQNNGIHKFEELDFDPSISNIMFGTTKFYIRN